MVDISKCGCVAGMLMRKWGGRTADHRDARRAPRGVCGESEARWPGNGPRFLARKPLILDNEWGVAGAGDTVS